MSPESKVHHQRHTLRLRGYDYSGIGAYFVTICTWNRKCLFGEVVDGKMCLNILGKIVEAEWLRTPTVRPQVVLDLFQVMPNHVHGIILLGDVLGEGKAVGPDCGRMQDAPTGHELPSGCVGRALWQAPRQTVGAIVRGFKGAATKRIVAATHDFSVIVWQRNYFEHVIRDDDDLERIREYISTNPARWGEDVENPERPKAKLYGASQVNP